MGSTRPLFVFEGGFTQLIDRIRAVAERVARRHELRVRLTHLQFSARTALEGLKHNRLRAGLTSLGILFGVASVIVMVSVASGAVSVCFRP